jgi:hypothetical protein
MCRSVHVILDQYHSALGRRCLSLPHGTFSAVPHGIDLVSWRQIMSKRVPSSPGDRDLNAKAMEALAEAERMRPGPERTEALERAEKLRQAATTYNYLFSSELKRPD